MGLLEGLHPRVGGETDVGADSDLLARCKLCRVSSGLGSSDLLGFESLEPLVRLAALPLSALLEGEDQSDT